MKRAHFSLLLALSIILPGCIMQKRSVMPGWHFEMSQNSRESIHSERVESDLVEEGQKVNGGLKGQLQRTDPTEKSARLNKVDPIIPIKSLMAYPLQIEIAHDRQLESKSTKAESQEVEHKFGEPSGANSSHNYVGSRFWKLWGAFLWGVFSITSISLGSGSVVLFVGLPLGIMAFRSLSWVFASNAAWAQRKGSKPFKRPFFPPKSVMQQQVRQQAEKLQSAENKRKRAVLKESRRAKRQAFFQSPSTKIATGFIGILLAYALFF